MRSTRLMTTLPAHLFIFVAAAISLLAPAAGATDKCGEVGGETWVLAESPYVVTCDVTVSAGTTLTIGAGVEVDFQNGTEMEVSGALDVNGTSSDRVVFSTASATPGWEDWIGVTFRSSATGNIDHALVEYSSYGFNLVDDASVNLTAVTARMNRFGITLQGTGKPTLSVTGCAITNNSHSGIRIDEICADPFSTPVTIVDSALHTNGWELAGMSVDVREPVDSESCMPYQVMARENWWGTVDQAEIDSMVRDDLQIPVDICDFLNGAGGEPARHVHCPDLLVEPTEVEYLTQTDKPYVVTSWMLVHGELHVGSGVEVRVEPSLGWNGIVVHGSAFFDSTPEHPALFTVDSATPAPGSWQGFQAWNDMTIRNAIFEYAVRGVKVGGYDVALENVTSRYSSQAGLEIYSTALTHEVTVADSTFTNGEHSGVHVEPAGGFEAARPSISITNSSIFNNTDWNLSTIFHEENFAIDARDNWWGTTDPEAIEDKILDYPYQTNWCGYLDGAGGSPVYDMHCPDRLFVCDDTVLLDQTDKPYLLVSDLYACPTGTLQVEAGVEVRLLDRSWPREIYVRGTLDVNGTEGAPVTFTSNAAAPQWDDWGGLHIGGNGQADLQHAAIHYAETGIDVEGASTVNLHGVEARLNGRALNVFGTNSLAVTATNCTFTDNTFDGIDIVAPIGGPDPTPVIQYSSIHDNGGYQYFADGFNDPTGTVLDANLNWWGTTDTVAISAGIYDSSDSSTSPVVRWCSYLDGPGGTGRDVNCPQTTVVCDSTHTWNLSDKPYLVTSGIYVCPTGVLEIHDGVDVLFAQTGTPLDFLVEGTLATLGTVSDPVTLTSDAATPAAGDWAGVKLDGSGSGLLDHTTISHGNYGIHVTGSATADLDGVTASFNQTGLRLFGTGPPSATAVSSSFVENTSYGVHVERHYTSPNPEFSVTQSSIHSNGSSHDMYAYNFTNAGAVVLNARENWWGTTDTTAIGPRIAGHRYNANNPRIDWCRYLDGPGGTPVLDAHCPDLAVCDETEVWNLTDKPYHVTTDFGVCPTGTLQVGPGVEVRTVKTSPRPDFLIEGTLDVNGTVGSPALFGSGAPTPAVGDWDGVELRGSSIATIENAEFNHGTYGLDVGDAAQAMLDGVTARLNQTGLRLHGPGPPSAAAVNSSFVENTSYGVYVERHYTSPNPDFSITQSSIHSNGPSHDIYAYNFTNTDSVVLNARENWWGTTDTTAIGPRVAGHRHNARNPRIDWCRYLDGPGGTPVLDAHCPDLAVCDETEVWDLTDKPYHVITDLGVCPSGTLQVGPGVDVRTVKTSPKPDFLIEGVLDVNGTVESPALFGSDAPTPAVGDWDGVELRGDSISTIENAEFNHGTYGLDISDAAQVTLDGVTARLNQTGLYVYGTGPPSATAVSSSFVENTNYGVHVQRHYTSPNPEFSVTQSSIHSNGPSHDIYAQNSTNTDSVVINARENWWGTTDTTAIGLRVAGHRHNTNNPRIDWCRYLDGPDGTPVLDAHCPDLAVCGETETWDLTDKPYHVTTDLGVCPTGTLQVGPGVEVRTVRMTSHRPDFEIEGTFDVNGTAGSPALFGSDAPTPAVGDWDGLKLRGSSISNIQNAEIYDATHGLDVGDAAWAMLHGVTARLNQTGLYVYGDGPPTVHAANSAFVENTQYGVDLRRQYLRPNPELTVTRSAIHSNLGSHDFYTYDFLDPDTTAVWVTDNWWGTTDTDQISDRIFDRDDSATSPWVRFRAFGQECDYAVGQDRDGDGHADFLDSCPVVSNAGQTDADLDGMGDSCDPEPGLAPSSACDGFQDMLDGWLDADGDGWGDPCDFHPLRDDSYPGATEICDARDNDGDAQLAAVERVDDDLDLGIVCGDCDDQEPNTNVCLCEVCGSGVDDDCDLLADGADPDCVPFDACIVLEAGAEPLLTMHKGVCGGATLSDPHDLIRGRVDALALASGSVDLGAVECVAADHTWDRATDASVNLNPKCNPIPVLFYLAKYATGDDYGQSSSGEWRDTMSPHPACVP